MNYAHALDATRPHTLLAVTNGQLASAQSLTGEPAQLEAALYLVYRYEDTGEKVVVRNAWDNQPFFHRVFALRKEAALLRQTGNLDTAGLREAAARWLAAMGDPAYPVAVVR